MELLKAKVVARALLDYASGLIGKDWFFNQDLVNLDFSRILPLMDNVDVQERLEALLAE